MTNPEIEIAEHALFRIENLSKRFPGVLALDKVNLEVNSA
jgi:ABC-type sugar transport system ATPase subunit